MKFKYKLNNKKFTQVYPMPSEDFLEYIDIDQKKFNSIIDSFRSPHIWDKTNKEWKLRKTL